MQFNSLQALLEMGGHGVYVWSALFITAAIVKALVLQPILKRRRLLKSIALRKTFEEGA